MKVTVRVTSNFKSELKPLLKRYRSLESDLLQLENALIENPQLGTPLGQNVFKIRLKITSKGRGKSGGARVITLVESAVIGMIEQTSQEITVSLLSIFDKSEIANISDKELKDLIKRFYKE